MSTIEELAAHATKAANAAAKAEEALEAARLAEEEEVERREREYDQQIIDGYNDAGRLSLEKDALRRFEIAVAIGEPGIAEWIEYRSARSLRMEANREVFAIAERLGVPSPATTLTSGGEDYTSGLQQAISKAVRDRVADELDRQDAARQRFVSAKS